jgi:chromosome partitioning protein
MMVGFAMSRADLVVIPTQGSLLDAAEAVKAVKLLRIQERAFRRRIPAAILFTRTSPAIRPRTLTNIEQQFEASDVPVFRVHLHERDAYKALFVFGGSLSGWTRPRCATFSPPSSTPAPSRRRSCPC